MAAHVSENQKHENISFRKTGIHGQPILFILNAK